MSLLDFVRSSLFQADFTYTGKEVAFLTKHRKEEILAPILKKEIECPVRAITSFDTDRLGTFTRDIARRGSQLDAARKKARLAVKYSSCALGLGSEGSFSADPVTGLLPWNREVLCFYDARNNHEIFGMAQGTAKNGFRIVTDLIALKDAAKELGFPEHHLVLRANSPDDPVFFKGISTFEELMQAYDELKTRSESGKVSLENDHRANHSPSRRKVIHAAALDLVQKILSKCPECQAPGFAATEKISGMPCRDCGLPTKLPASEKWKCNFCNNHEVKAVEGSDADPAQCDYCNP